MSIRLEVSTSTEPAPDESDQLAVDLEVPEDSDESLEAYSAADDEDESDLEGLDEPETFDAVVVATDWTAETLLGQIQRGNLQLDPDFQRRDAWSRTRRGNAPHHLRRRLT